MKKKNEFKKKTEEELRNRDENFQKYVNII